MPTPYRSKSVFDFEDEYGSDPILFRYGGVSPEQKRSDALKVQLAEADRLQAEAGLKLAQAEEEARLAPLRNLHSEFERLNNLTAERDKYNNDMNRQRAVSALHDNISSWKTVSDVDNFVKDNPAIIHDQAQAERIRLTRAQLVDATKADLRSRVARAITTEDLREAKNWAAQNQLITMPDIKEMFAEYEPLVENNERLLKELSKRNLATPVTPQGEFDTQRAEAIVGPAGLSNKELFDFRRSLTKQIEDIEDGEGDASQLEGLKESLAVVDRQLANSVRESQFEVDRRAAAATGLSMGDKGFVNDLIFGPGSNSQGDSTAPAPAPGDSTAPTPAPTPGSATGTERAAPPESTQSELDRANIEYELARRKAPRPGAMPIEDMPAPLAYVAENLDPGYAPAKEASAKARQIEKELYPYADSGGLLDSQSNMRDPQEIQKALSIVYPAIEGSPNRFDIGDRDDPKVIMAADFLRQIKEENPDFLRMVASSPAWDGVRTNLTLQEIDEIASKADELRGKKKRRSARGTKQK